MWELVFKNKSGGASDGVSVVMKPSLRPPMTEAAERSRTSSRAHDVHSRSSEMETQSSRRR